MKEGTSCSYKRVQNPLLKKKPTVPKFQNQSKIYSIKNINIEQEKKFQTQEQIQTEKQSLQFYDNSPSHKNKNQKREWKRSAVDILSSKHIPAIQKKFKTPFLSVYYCDSIAIRPMSQNQKLEDIFNSSKTQSIQKKVIQKVYSKDSFIQKVQRKETNNGKLQQQSTQIQSILCAQLKNKFKSRKKIFSHKESNKGLKLSRAIRRQLEIQEVNKLLGVNQFHITFQSDKITQCCT